MRMVGDYMNLVIDVFIGASISVFLSVLFTFLIKILIRNFKNVESIRVGATFSVLIVSCILNGFLICWLLINYNYLPNLFDT